MIRFIIYSSLLTVLAACGEWIGPDSKIKYDPELSLNSYCAYYWSYSYSDVDQLNLICNRSNFEQTIVDSIKITLSGGKPFSVSGYTYIYGGVPVIGPIYTPTKNEVLIIKDWYPDSLISGRFKFVYKDNKIGKEKGEWDFCVEMKEE